MTNRTRTIDTAEVARLIRKDLKAVFGNSVKFSVRTSRYAGGSSIRVSWTDGPTVDMVERIAKGYAGGGFDGMTDYKYRFDSYLDGERVRFGVDFVFCARRLSDDFKERASAAVERKNPVDDWTRNSLYREEINKRCDARIVQLFAANFTGPRATADVEQAERERTSVYPQAERDDGAVAGAQPADDVERFDNADDALVAARRGDRINVFDLAK